MHQQRDYVVIGVKLGNAMVTADIGLTALQKPPGEMSEMNVLNKPGLLGCASMDLCETEQVSLLKRFPVIDCFSCHHAYTVG